MSKLTVAIITFNEERNIRRCLESVKNFADEIVVVDSGSTDATPEICQEYQVKFVVNPFTGHIEQKNFALELASNDYVLSLDADEEVTHELKQSILRCIARGFPADGYRFNRLSNYCGSWIKHGSWYPDTKLRLINKNKARWGGVNPHDKMEMQPGAHVEWIAGDLNHYSYYTVDEHIRKIDYFSTIAAISYHSRGKKAGLFQLIIHPGFTFFRDYILRAGFRDGYPGYQIARLASWYTFLKYIKLRQIIQEKTAQQTDDSDR